MDVTARKLEGVMKEVNEELQRAGILSSRSALDVWTRLMSCIVQVGFTI